MARWLRAGGPQRIMVVLIGDEAEGRSGFNESQSGEEAAAEIEVPA